MAKDKSDPGTKPEKSAYSLKSRASLEATHARHQPKVYGCRRCYPPTGYPEVQ